MSIDTRSFETAPQVTNSDQEDLPPVKLIPSDPLMVAAELHESLSSYASKFIGTLNGRLRSIGNCASAQSIAPESPDSLALRRASANALRVNK